MVWCKVHKKNVGSHCGFCPNHRDHMKPLFRRRKESRNKRNLV